MTYSNSVCDSTFTFSLTMSLPTVPDPPTGMPGQLSITSTSLEFSWSPPANDGGSAITGYQIWYDGGSGVLDQMLFYSTVSGSSVTVAGLMPIMDYWFRVAAINSYGISILSPLFMLTT